ncbi:MAG: alpha/beta fold hydrolase, partial [Propionibacteriaceae bacterium]|nr:alpha/beta fold hydrolase [Propionibacteriaceae bacterium]
MARHARIDGLRARGLGSVLLVMVLMLSPLPALADDPQVTETELTMPGTPEADGKPVPIDVSLMTTDSTVPQPAIVLAHGFGGTKADSASTARTLARDGYTVITYTARGFGKSGGQIHLNNPRYEGADARLLVDLAARRPEVLHTGNDPVIGFAGASYGGAISLLVAGLDRRVDAIAPAFTWHSLTQALFPQYATTGSQRSLADVQPIDQAGVFKQRWASLFFLGGGGSGAGGAPPGSNEGAQLCGRFTSALCRGYLETAQTGIPSPQLIKLLDESDVQDVLSDITAPTLLTNGVQDTLFPLDHADANLRGLPASTPAKMEWVQGGHDAQIDIGDLIPDLKAWFGRYLKQDGSPPDTSFTVSIPEASLVGEGDTHDPQTLTAPTYPGRGTALSNQTLPLNGAPQTMFSPPGGTPAALTNLPGTGGALGALSSVGGYALGVLAGQSATFTTEPLDQPLTLVGSGSVQLEVSASTSDVTLFASLWDLGPDVESPGPSEAPQPSTRSAPGTAILPQLALAPIRLTGLTPGTTRRVQVALPPIAHQVPVGHRLQVVVASTDQAYSVPLTAAVYTVGLGGDRAVLLPRLEATALNANTLDVPLPLVLVVAGLVLAGLLAMIVLWLRRRSAHPREDLRSTPLVVEDLVKTYGDGFKAVDGVSFSAEAGQVVGLLGPNGAGKTTTMRMLVGLIRPDSGSVYVAGEPVHAGADVLASVGAFIEGPGFLPHLSGRQNLNAYWGATGRPIEDAHLDEALKIAGLGSAIDRRVRTYSHGMRQRLGIAQAMLGLPTLLLLDEPTNGLDPPQIKAMRSVLADYAAAGRTVVVSSHLLSEVEQTCTHVVVMHKGKVILTGAMNDLTAQDDVT